MFESVTELEFMHSFPKKSCHLWQIVVHFLARVGGYNTRDFHEDGRVLLFFGRILVDERIVRFFTHPE